MTRLPYVFMGLGILLALGFASFFAQKSEPMTRAPQFRAVASIYFETAPDMATATIEYVIDGDTVVLADGEHVRYIGMNAPEIAHPEYNPTSADQCFGPEATQENKNLVLRKTVHLGRDIENKDKYGRLLRYIWAGETMIDLELTQLGYARVLTIAPNTKYAVKLKAAETAAKAKKLGLWGMCR